jgi:hypothetical protein
MANAIEQKVDVSRAVGDLRLTVEQQPDPPEHKTPHSEKTSCRELPSQTQFKSCGLRQHGYNQPSH